MRVNSFATVVCLLVLAGSLFWASASAAPVAPAAGQKIIVDYVVFLVDCSGSMGAEARFQEKQNLLSAFAAAMPDGNYWTGVVSYGKWSGYGKVRLPLGAFNRSVLSSEFRALAFEGGLSRLEWAIRKGRNELLSVRPGPAAMIVISDGVVDEANVLDAAQYMESLLGNRVCIHTVQCGSDAAGGATLRNLAAVSPSSCGSSHTAGALKSEEAVREFVCQVFFGSGCGKAEILDSDGDGVPDDRDKCPDTPKGVQVDADGCPLDTDGDGVYDYLDHCPGTPKGAKVDDRGCWVIQGLYFDFDKYDIKPKYMPLLDEVVTVLQNNPGVSVRIDGHTDSRGTDAYNQKLSERRAKSVYNYFTSHGISANRLTTKGWGESKPIRPNDTEENMQYNRRVELTPVK